MGGVVDSALGMLGMDGGGSPQVTQAQEFNIGGGLFGGGSFDPTTGEIIQQGTPESQRIGAELLGQAQGQFRRAGMAGGAADRVSRGALSALDTFDPFAAAEEQFGRLDAILEPGRARARAGSAASLLSGGRLGSTGGARETAEVEGEIERQRQQLLGQSFGQAQGMRRDLVGEAVATGGLGLQQRQGAQSLATASLGGALNIDAQTQAALGLGSQISSPAAVTAGQESLGSQFMGGLASGGAAALVGLI